MVERFPTQSQIDRAFRLARRDCSGRGCIRGRGGTERCVVASAVNRLAEQRGWYFGPKTRTKLTKRIRQMFHEYRKRAAKRGTCR